MNMFKRVTSIFKSEVHSFLDKIEDSTKLLETSIQDSEKRIQNMKEALAKQIALGKHFEEKEKDYTVRIDKLIILAESSIQTQNELAAREAIQEKIKEQNKLAELQNSIVIHNENTEKYRKKLKKAVSELDDMKVKKETLIIKHNMVKNELEMNKKFGNHNTKQLLKKIQTEIWEAEALNTIENEVTVDDKIQDIEMVDEVEKELKILKEKMG